jgi:tRNA(adenine34) deaminase
MTDESIAGNAPGTAAADAHWLRAAIAAARRARETGDAPYGAVLVAADGTLLLEAGNTVHTTRDFTAHAELNAVRLATARFDEATLAGATLYASTEPCPMCAAAIFWGGIGRVVFGLSSARWREVYDQAGSYPALPFACAEVLTRSTRAIEVVGPLLEDEALAVHAP